MVLAPVHTGKLMLNWPMKFPMFPLVWRSSKETAVKTTPRGAYSLAASTSIGISVLQGTHQVAQKFSTTILPRRSDTRTFFPFMSLNGEVIEWESLEIPRPGIKLADKSRAIQESGYERCSRLGDTCERC